MTIVVTSIVIVIFYSLFSPNQRNSVSVVMQVKAAKLGQAYLEEISLKRFDESSPIGNLIRCNQTPAITCGAIINEEGLLNRSLFDDVDDYHGLIDQPPKDSLGNSLSGFNNFSVTVQVSYAGSDFGLNNQDLKKIQVNVISPTNDTFVFSQYKGNF